MPHNPALQNNYVIEADQRAIDLAPKDKYEQGDRIALRVGELLRYVNCTLMPSLGYQSQWNSDGLHTDKPLPYDVLTTIRGKTEELFKIPVRIKNLTLEKRVAIQHRKNR